MLEVEGYMESFKQSISKRFERYDERFHSFEVSQSECQRRLRDLERAKSRTMKDKDIELQKVKNILFRILFTQELF